MVKNVVPSFFPIYSATPIPLLYCSCCLGTTGHIFSCCSGMSLIQSDSWAVSACLSRTVRNPVGFCLTVCLLLEDPGLFTSLFKAVSTLFASFQQEAVLIFSVGQDLNGLFWHVGAYFAVWCRSYHLIRTPLIQCLKVYTTVPPPSWVTANACVINKKNKKLTSKHIKLKSNCKSKQMKYESR